MNQVTCAKFPSPSALQHSRLTLDDAITQYNANLLTATGLVYHAVKIYRKDGYKITVKNVDAFCERLTIKRATFYKALQKLKKADFGFRCESVAEIQLWFETNSPDDIDESTDGNDESTVGSRQSTTVESKSTIVDSSSPTVDSESKTVENKSLKSACSNSFGESTTIDQLSSQLFTNKHTQEKSVSVSLKNNGREEPTSRKSVSTSNQNSHPLGYGKKDKPNETPAQLNNSQQGRSSKWQCPGTPEQRLEFFKYKGSLMVRDGLCTEAEAQCKALAWANYHQEEADLLWNGWLKSKGIAPLAHNWDTDPRTPEWLKEIEETKNPIEFSLKGKERREFVKWAYDTKQFSWQKKVA